MKFSFVRFALRWEETPSAFPLGKALKIQSAVRYLDSGYDKSAQVLRPLSHRMNAAADDEARDLMASLVTPCHWYVLCLLHSLHPIQHPLLFLTDLELLELAFPVFPRAQNDIPLPAGRLQNPQADRPSQKISSQW